MQGGPDRDLGHFVPRIVWRSGWRSRSLWRPLLLKVSLKEKFDEEVKVWFQNRRTKHKRQKQEEEQNTRQSDHKSGSSASSGEAKHHQHPHSTGSHDYPDKHNWQNGDDMPSSPISDDGSMVEIESAPDSPEMAPLST
ncbi:homeobox domain-containing protein [Trichonephila clavata]|uniref:Homeobox domain-containing protein n=1 Tax=Trichonephila clavata TaxID=2740835 RepID=A0A8X6HNV5_TRICU|nr:homeobox domain-containing protein [Trichonephila clavata]